ncbi:unnamed protein product [Prorocentrum cordatum]|uniref:Prefoldin subunit 6 n=1 Tax=Prorocentrum cordatum TaxID=2364126 RepID=A0ABN9QUC1_9DINO|nr:unnamed protein product [Polarella glacialis]
MAPDAKELFERELEGFKALQDALQKSYETRMCLIGQQQETELVQDEFATLEEGSQVFKLVGPVMVKQNVDDAKANVEKRMDYIRGELDRANTLCEEREKELQEKQRHLARLQQDAAGAAG